MGIHEPTLAIAKKYTNDTVIGMGALKGAPCMAGTPYRDTQSGKTGTVVPMEWTDTEGADHITPVFIPDGEAGKITGVTATVDETTGTPVVEVTMGGTAENRTFAFAFSGIKGETGTDGEDGRGISSIIIPDPSKAQIQVEYDDGTSSELIDIPVVNGEDGFSPTITVHTNTPTVYKLDITDVNGTITTPNLRGGGGGGGSLSDDLTTSITVGGISAGTTYEAGDALEDIFRDMLCPALYPTLTNPSVSLSVPGSKLLESGSWVEKTFTLALDRGSINPAYGTNGYRSGEFTMYYVNDGAGVAIPSGSTSVTFNRYVGDNGNGDIVNFIKTVVANEQGEQPKDSKGNNYSYPYPASLNTLQDTVSFELVDALWANWLDMSTDSIVVKQPLVSKTDKKHTFAFLEQTVGHPNIFDVPASWTVTAVEVKNDLSGAWEDCSAEFTVTDTTHPDADDRTVNYKRYTDNRGYAAGAREVRIRWS